MKASKRKFNQGGYYENKTDFVLKPTDFSALGAGYDELTMKYMDAQRKAKQEQDKKAREGIRAFESRTKVMDRHNGVVQAAYDISEQARLTAISNPSAANKQAADEAYSQYSVIKENAVAITADYQKEVNDLMKGSLDANLLGTRAQAVAEAKEFNQEIPFKVVGNRIMVPGADNEDVEYLQSTFVNEGVFGQNGRNFIASRRAPGTDFMFAPLSDSYSNQLQGDEDIFNIVDGRKKGLNEAAVGSLVAQRLQTDFMANPAAFVDAVSTQYGAYSYGVENLNVDNMNKATADYGGIDLYKNELLTNWSLTYNPETEENAEGSYTLSFVNSLDDLKNSGKLNPLDAAAIENRRKALKYHIENTANQTLFKLKNVIETTPQDRTGSGSGYKKGDRLPEFRTVGLYNTPSGTVTGQSMDLAVEPVPIRFLGKSAKITNILYDPSAANNKNPRDVVYGFTLESGPIKDAALTNINQEISDLTSEIRELQTDITNQVFDKREATQAQINSLRDRRNELREDRKNVQKLSEEFSITRASFDRPSPEQALFRNIATAGGMGDVPGFDEILTSLYSQERDLMEAAESQFIGAVSSQPSSSAGVGAKYN